jgi:PAS domain S-box-containing protein
MQRSKDWDIELHAHVPDFRALLDALPGRALILLPDDPKYTIAAANQASFQSAGASSNGMLGRCLFEALFEQLPGGASESSDSSRELRASLRQVLASKKPHSTEFEAGGRSWRATHAPLLDEEGDVQFILQRTEDLSERTDTGSIEARYGLAFAQAPIGMVLVHPDGRIIQVNQAFLDTLGYTREDLLTRDSSSFTHPEDVQLTKDFFTSLKNGPHNSGSIEKRYVGKDGTILWARATANMRRDEQGRPADVIAIVEDITERKRAEEQLWASQAQLRAIYDGTYEYIGLLSPDGILLDCNRASLEFAGGTLEDLIGRPFWEIPWFAFTPGAPELVRQGIAIAAGGQFVRYETPLRRPSGAEVTLDFSIYPVRNERGEVIFLVPEGRDITEQNRAAQQIEDDRRRWRELLRQTPAGIVLLRGPEHKYDWMNPAMERMFGRSAETLLGKTVKEAYPGFEMQTYLDLLDGVYRTGEPFTGHEAPVRFAREDGTLQDLYLNFVYLPTRDLNGDIDGIFVHVTDVTSAVLARMRIEESERQFRTLAETIPHLAWMADQAGNRFWYNRRWYDYTGTTLEEVKDWGWKKVHDPAVLPEVLKRWRDALASGEAFEILYPVRGADGSFRSFLTRVEPVKNLEGRVVRWFGTNTDITDQRKTEEELRRMNRELEEFAYVASHDLQEPLRMVNIYTQMLLADSDASPEERKEYAGFVRAGVERMEALIQDLLTFSRNVHREQQPVGTADMAAALDEAIAVLRGRIEEAGAVIQAGVLPRARGETQQLAHVFQNILSNALKYRKKDVPLEVRISSERGPRQWTICIRDNGIGFEPQYSERIFGLFKRLHKDEYPGTGLGLAICQRIIERYGGHIWAQGSPGEGASFYFSLPSVVGE